MPYVSFVQQLDSSSSMFSAQTCVSTCYCVNQQNVFVHFEPIGRKGRALEFYDPDLDIPPYIVPGSRWHRKWVENHEKGWFSETFDVLKAATRGDLTALKIVAQQDPSKLQAKDDLGWEPIHEAARSGQIQTLQLFLEYKIDINKKTYAGDTPLAIALKYLGENHAATKWLIENAASTVRKSAEL
eukprot:scaffold405_cov132-Cylindrotheca_fusiformis.AAC.13